MKNNEESRQIINIFGEYLRLLLSSRGLVVMHSTQTNMVLGSRPDAGDLWRQEGHPVLTARARLKVLPEAPSKPQGIGENGGKIEYLRLMLLGRRLLL